MSWTPDPGQAGSYTVTFTTANGLASPASTAITVTPSDPTSGIIPAGHGVDRAWVRPTPLRGSGTLHFISTRPGPVTNALYDLRGGIVRELMDGVTLPAGTHRVDLDGRDGHGEAIPSGMYLDRVALPDRVIGGKLLVIR